MLSLPIELHEISISKLLSHHFWLGLMVGVEFWAPWFLGYLFCFIVISWGCLTSPIYFILAMSQFDWPIAKKVGVLPLWPTYIGEKGRTLGKTYGIKVRCYWEHPWGTHRDPREHIGNALGTKEK